MKEMKRGAMLKRGVALVAGILLAGCSLIGAEEVITVDGSTTVGPIVKAFGEYFMKNNPTTKVNVSESGSGNGAKSLGNGTCDVAAMSRFMKDTEFTAGIEKKIFPVAHVVALDGLAVIVHPSNPVKELTLAQVKDIYIGKIATWSEVGGPNEKIVLISRDTNSGTYEAFKELVVGKEKMSDTAEYVGSNGASRARVQSTPSAIAFVGLGFLDASVKALAIDKVEANQANVISGVYPISRPLFLFTNGYPKLGSSLYRFVTLYLSKDGQKMIEEIGFVPSTQY